MNKMYIPPRLPFISIAVSFSVEICFNDVFSAFFFLVNTFTANKLLLFPIPQNLASERALCLIRQWLASFSWERSSPFAVRVDCIKESALSCNLSAVYEKFNMKRLARWSNVTLGSSWFCVDLRLLLFERTGWPKLTKILKWWIKKVGMVCNTEQKKRQDQGIRSHFLFSILWIN